jgi:hypothetical protein
MKPDAPALYEDGKNNTLLNDVFFYVLHHLPRLQNMHEYSVDAGQDIEAFVKRKYPQLEGPPSVPPVFFFSKNLLAYLETLVAFCPYYRADDARMAGKMEAFYQEAVNRYKAYTDDKLHDYTAWKFENVLTLALLKGLRLVHFFRGPLKELANAISGSPQAAARR